MLLEILGVRPDRQGLVVSEATFIMELDPPAAFLFFLLRGSILDLVAHNLDIIPFRTDQMNQERPDDWCHARREDYDWDTVLSRPFVEVVEIGVELDVVAEFLDALRKRCFDALHHGSEGVPAAAIRPSNFSRPFWNCIAAPKGVFSLQDILIALPAKVPTKAKIIRLKVI